jgi:hypothetical protein
MTMLMLRSWMMVQQRQRLGGRQRTQRHRRWHGHPKLTRHSPAHPVAVATTGWLHCMHCMLGGQRAARRLWLLCTL